MKNINFPTHQGDVVIRPIKELPKGLKEIKHKGNYILKHGESGNAHTLVADKTQDLKLYMDKKTKELYFVLSNLAVLNHGGSTTEVHNPLNIDIGIYRVGDEKEYNYFTQEIEKSRD